MAGSQTKWFAEVGDESIVEENVVLGLRYAPDRQPSRLGTGCIIRAFTVIYADVTAGDFLKTGHHVTIREHTLLGDHVTVGTGSVLDSHVSVGSYVKIESCVYIPAHTTIGNCVFIGPGAVLTNDKYPLRWHEEYEPHGPVLEDNVSIGANATLLPGIRIGAGAMVAAGSVVTADVTPWSLAIGAPARIEPLPDEMKEPNRAIRW